MIDVTTAAGVLAQLVLRIQVATAQAFFPPAASSKGP
jgi:hypothetical protein